MATIRRADPMLVQQYQVASVMAAIFNRKNEIEAEAAEWDQINQRQEWRKSVLAVVGLALYVAVVFWPVILTR